MKRDRALTIGDWRASAGGLGLMAFDALVVGLLAALIGSALFVAFRSGASWRGWAEETIPA